MLEGDDCYKAPVNVDQPRVCISVLLKYHYDRATFAQHVDRPHDLTDVLQMRDVMCEVKGYP